jgi:hypothetical protein
MGRKMRRGALNWFHAGCKTQIFTVIHVGGQIDEEPAVELINEVSAWAMGAGPGSARVVEVWDAPWNWLVNGHLISAGAMGAPVLAALKPVADVLVNMMKQRGLTVRHRHGRRSAVVEAELRAMSRGWPVRYIG